MIHRWYRIYRVVLKIEHKYYDSNILNTVTRNTMPVPIYDTLVFELLPKKTTNIIDFVYLRKNIDLFFKKIYCPVTIYRNN